jgi:hypothetical protein
MISTLFFTVSTQATVDAGALQGPTSSVLVVQSPVLFIPPSIPGDAAKPINNTADKPTITSSLLVGRCTMNFYSDGTSKSTC